MKANKTLKLTLEEYGYKLSDLIFPSEGLEMAIVEAMERHAQFYHESKVKNLNKHVVSSNEVKLFCRLHSMRKNCREYKNNKNRTGVEK